MPETSKPEKIPHLQDFGYGINKGTDIEIIKLLHANTHSCTQLLNPSTQPLLLPLSSEKHTGDEISQKQLGFVQLIMWITVSG